MPDISILQFARAVHETTLLGVAQKVGVKPPPPPISVRNLFNTRTFDSGFLTTDRPLGGSITIVLDNTHGDGEATIRGGFHNSGFDNIDYTVTAVLVTPGFKAFTFQHSGHTEGTSADYLLVPPIVTIILSSQQRQTRWSRKIGPMFLVLL
jgi:hypothetical protein